jgi:hypothetical protein
LLSRAELKATPRGRIEAKIAQALAWDDVAWAEQQGVSFAGRNRAEHAEQALWFCGRCGGWGTLRSRGNELFCSECGHRAWCAPGGHLRHDPVSGAAAAGRSHLAAEAATPPATVADWNAQQSAELRREIAVGITAGAGAATGALPYRIPAMDYATGYRSRPLRGHGTVAVELGYETFTLTPIGDGASRRRSAPAPIAAVSIPVAQIRGIHVQYATQLEFYHDGTLHVLRSGRPQDSVMRLEETVLALQELYKTNKH